MSKKMLVLIICLCASLLTISVGYSALSTTLSINGSAFFEPVGMIRVTGFKSVEEKDTVETSHNYTMATINTLLDINSNDGYITYDTRISNLGEIDEELTKIEPIIFSNEQMEYEISGIKIGDVIKTKENVNFKITFKYKNGITPIDTRLNVKIKFYFEKYEPITVEPYKYEKSETQEFSGKDSYINTGIQPFNKENYLKNFVLKLTIKNVPDERFSANKRDTIFNMLYEANDKNYGIYPGVLLRIEGNKWQLQGGDGQTAATKKLFNKNDLLGKEIKIIRHNNNGNIKIYYIIGDSEPILLKDITNLYKPFDTPLTFGANLEIDNKTPNRYAYATLENVSFDFFKDGLTLNELLGKEEKQIDNPKPLVNETFINKGSCIFNGANLNITGEECTKYNNTKYIDTGIYLFNKDNYQKDFDLSFTIDNYMSSEQEEAQVTVMNAFLERTGRGYGILLRRNRNRLNLIVRDGNGAEKDISFNDGEIKTMQLVRKNMKICYSINNQPFIKLIDSSNFNAPFDVPVTFGASLDSQKNPWRFIKGTLSNMNITLGTIDSNIVCE